MTFSYLDVRVEVGGDTNRGPVITGLEGHAVDTSNELVRGVQKGSHASVCISETMKSHAHAYKRGEKVNEQQHRKFPVFVLLPKVPFQQHPSMRVMTASPVRGKKQRKHEKEGTSFFFVLPSSKAAPGVVGGSVEDLELDGDIATGMTAG